MGRILALVILLSLLPIAQSAQVSPRPAVKQFSAEEFTLLQVLDRLASSSAGKVLIEKAKRKWLLVEAHEILEFVKWGDVSKTDALLTRHLDSETGREYRERKVTVYLRRDQGLDETILDLSHELTHALNDPGWDPYDPALTAGQYIRSTIEGPGGEVEALFFECQVAIELDLEAGGVGRCESYFEVHDEKVIRAKIRDDFYRVGKWHDHLIERLGSEKELFPSMSPKAPQLYSSTGHSPYPVSLYHEYVELTQIACRNTIKRLELLRAPSSFDGSAIRKQSATFIQKRCAQETADSNVFSSAFYSGS